MFGDYTISEAAQLLDLGDDVVAEVANRGGIPTRRRFLLFGSLLIDKNFVDSIAPDMRAYVQRTGGTRKEREKVREEMLETQQQTEQMKEDMKRDREEHNRLMNEMMADFAKKMRAKMEEQQKPSKSSDGKDASE